jgi:hypothetical protein
MKCEPTYQDDEGDIHIVPKDNAEHERDSSCWCDPIIFYIQEETGQKVWRHKWVN